MSAIKAIFTKQMADLPKNMSVLLLFIMWPLMAFVIGNLMGYVEIQAGMFASMLIASGPMVSIANNVAEDNEYKGLRFLVMAGVKPWQYLVGMAGAFILVSVLSLASLFWIGGVTGDVLLRASIVGLLGLIASSILGGAVGIFAKNVQQAAAISTPLMMILGFAPMFAAANETLARIAEFLFPMQVMVVILNPYADFTRALIVIAGNAVVLLAFFAIAYKKKGLRG
ncbi:MAG: ABC transporter permease [Oscillospiraceae bacterium]|nr:ABC transporter permease [Oscillospiraceae bacterium]